MWVMMVQHKTSNQYLTSGKVSTRSIHRFKRYRFLKTLTKHFNILSNADAVVTAIALPVLTYRQAKKPEALGPRRSPECTAMKAIFSQNTVNVACKKN